MSPCECCLGARQATRGCLSSYVVGLFAWQLLHLAGAFQGLYVHDSEARDDHTKKFNKLKQIMRTRFCGSVLWCLFLVPQWKVD